MKKSKPKKNKREEKMNKKIRGITKNRTVAFNQKNELQSEKYQKEEKEKEKEEEEKEKDNESTSSSSTTNSGTDDGEGSDLKREKWRCPNMHLNPIQAEKCLHYECESYNPVRHRLIQNQLNLQHQLEQIHQYYQSSSSSSSASSASSSSTPSSTSSSSSTPTSTSSSSSHSQSSPSTRFSPSSFVVSSLRYLDAQKRQHHHHHNKEEQEEQEQEQEEQKNTFTMSTPITQRKNGNGSDIMVPIRKMALPSECDSVTFFSSSSSSNIPSYRSPFVTSSIPSSSSSSSTAIPHYQPPPPSLFVLSSSSSSASSPSPSTSSFSNPLGSTIDQHVQKRKAPRKKRKKNRPHNSSRIVHRAGYSPRIQFDPEVVSMDTRVCALRRVLASDSCPFVPQTPQSPLSSSAPNPLIHHD